jgi:tetratricopeptide (TPR) repeat protein
MDTQEAQREAAVRAARGAIQEHRWKDAFELLLEADAERPLEAADLEALAEAAWFNARADLSIEIKERAFRAHVDAGAPERAAIVAFDLGREYSLKRQFSIAAAWAGRGARLLEGRPDSAAHGYLALSRSHVHETAGDMDGAMEEAARAVEVGARFGDADLQAWGLIQRGSILIRLGRIDEGFTFMEEATIAAVNGELRPMSTGVVYCTMIAVCRDITDYGRAGEWTEAAKRWCERQAINGFPGVCRVHRGEILALQGALEQAERELLTATEEIALYNATPPLADGFYALAEIRMRLGDLAGAEEALRQAHSLGRSPQPALALIRLAEGKLKAAVSAIDSAVAEEQTDLWHRARLLPAQVEIAVANADPETARTAAEEIARISDTYRSPALHAAKHDSFGRVLLAEGDAEAASRELRTAIRHWQEVGAPYEVARDRVVLSTVLRALGHDDAADLELETARSEFDRLGAALDLAAATEAIRAEQERRAAPTTTRKTFLFTDIVGSTNLAGAMGDEADSVRPLWRAGRELDRRRLLRGVRHGRPRHRVCRGHPACAGGPPPDERVRPHGPHRRSHGAGYSPRLRLHGSRRPRRRPDRGAGGRWPSAGVGGNGERGDHVLPDRRSARGDPQGRHDTDPRRHRLLGRGRRGGGGDGHPSRVSGPGRQRITMAPRRGGIQGSRMMWWHGVMRTPAADRGLADYAGGTKHAPLLALKEVG